MAAIATHQVKTSANIENIICISVMTLKISAGVVIENMLESATDNAVCS